MFLIFNQNLTYFLAMLFKIKELLLIIIVLLFMMSCGDNLTKTTKDESATITMSYLDGTWLTECRYHSSTSNSSKIEIVFSDSGDNATSTVTYYSGTICNNRSYLYKEKIRSISLQSKSELANGLKVTKYTGVISDVTITPVTSTTATSFNNNSTCGLSSWSNNTETSIAGRTCGSTTYSSINDGFKSVLQMNSEKTYIKIGNQTLDSEGYPTGLYSDKYFKQ